MCLHRTASNLVSHTQERVHYKLAPDPPPPFPLGPSFLSGHEKYFRTTAYGLTGHLPDYACLIVGANMGVVGMCKEHLGVALALKVPVFFVVTKVDICPEHILKNTVQVREGGGPGVGCAKDLQGGGGGEGGAKGVWE